MPTFTFRPVTTPALSFRLHDTVFTSKNANTATFGAAPLVAPVAVGIGRKIIQWGGKKVAPAALLSKWIENIVKKGITGHADPPSNATEERKRQEYRRALYALTEIGLMFAYGSTQWLADPPVVNRDTKV